MGSGLKFKAKAIFLAGFSLKSLVKNIAQKAGITKRIYPQIFRHSRAAHSIKNGEFRGEGFPPRKAPRKS